jgi:Spy/CpxP family protein refolding chaperone
MFSFRRAATGLALAAALLTPAAAFAQQAPSQDAQAQQQSPHRQGGFANRFQDLNLSDQQKTQIQQIVQNFRQSHQGQPPSAQDRQQLQSQIDAVLTPQQRQQLAADMQKRGTENEAGESHGMGGGHMKAEMDKLNLSAAQRTQIQTLMTQFHKAHQGQRPSATERQQFHQQLLNVLTPQQRTQFENDRQQWRSQHPEPAATP